MASTPACSPNTQPDDAAIDHIARWLRCPSCAGGPLHRDGRRLACPAGHAFDLARQGYATLASGHRRHRGDDVRMVLARERFLGRGHYQPLTSTIAVLAAEHGPGADGIVVDLAGGAGHHLAGVLDLLPHRHGLCIDASTPALRRAARTHPRIAAVGADVWSALPVRTGAASAVVSVFGPRNVPEMTRIAGPGGIVVVATPRPTHLTEIATLVGAVGVDPRKPERLAASFEDFERIAHQEVAWRVALQHQDARDVVAMGPAARHVTEDDLDRIIAGMPEVVGATVAVEVSVYRSRDVSGRAAARSSPRPAPGSPGPECV